MTLYSIIHISKDLFKISVLIPNITNIIIELLHPVPNPSLTFCNYTFYEQFDIPVNGDNSFTHIH